MSHLEDSHLNMKEKLRNIFWVRFHPLMLTKLCKHTHNPLPLLLPIPPPPQANGFRVARHKFIALRYLMNFCRILRGLCALHRCAKVQCVCVYPHSYFINGI